MVTSPPGPPSHVWVGGCGEGGVGGKALLRRGVPTGTNMQPIHTPVHAGDVASESKRASVSSPMLLITQAHPECCFLCRGHMRTAAAKLIDVLPVFPDALLDKSRGQSLQRLIRPYGTIPRVP